MSHYCGIDLHSIRPLQVQVGYENHHRGGTPGRYSVPGRVDITAKEDLNRFLNTWLKNCLDQGHHFSGVPNEDAVHHG